MRFTTSYKFGDVVLVSFPFTDQQRSKQRPAVGISSTAYAARRPDIIALAITSKIHPADSFLVEDWQQAGLLKLSAFKPLITSLEKGMVVQNMGSLSSHDQDTLARLLRAMPGPPKHPA